jgi:hypothetical protein
LDSTPPSLAVEPISADDPGRISVVARDAVSGVARGEVEVRREGDQTWHALETELTPTGFAAYLDDERFVPGTYQVRARATDRAGNERSTESRTTGELAVLAVPLRIPTALTVGHVKRVRAGRRNRSRRVVVTRPLVRFGKAIPVEGHLTSPGGNPLADSALEIFERVGLPGQQWRRLAILKTDAGGKFRFRALRGPSRTLRFRYPGTPLVQPQTADVDLRVRARSSLRVSRRRVVNGEDVVFSGRVAGRPLPDNGKLLQLQVLSRGGWLTFATPRARPATGRWAYRYRFTATRGRVDYRFRVRLPKEAGYPYAAGRSRPVLVSVRGL